MRPKTDDYTRAFMREAWVKRLDLTVVHIAEICGVHPRTVGNICADLPRRLNLRAREVTDARDAEIVELLRRWGVRDVARIAGVAPSTVSRAAERMGVRMRSPGRRGAAELERQRGSR